MAKKKTSWYTKGNKGWEKGKKIDKENKEKRDNPDWRFRLPYDSEAKATFLDTPTFFFHEHTVKRQNGKYESVTCIKDFDHCPLCDDNNSSYCVAATIIDHRTAQSKDGEKTFKNQKRLAVFKGKARQVLERRIKHQKDNIKLCMFTFARGNNPTECGTGEDIMFTKKVPAKSLAKVAPKGTKPKDFLTPIDYSEKLKPLTPEEMRSRYNLDSPVGNEDDLEDDVENDVENDVEDDDLDLTGDDETEDAFDEDAIKADLKKLKSKKAIAKYIKENEVEGSFKKSMSLQQLRDAILEALQEAAGVSEEEDDDDLLTDDDDEEQETDDTDTEDGDIDDLF